MSQSRIGYWRSRNTAHFIIGRPKIFKRRFEAIVRNALGIETFYNQLKSKANLENFSGKSIRAIKQDFYAKLFILNLSTALVRPVEKLLEEKPKKKWTHKVNMSDALGYMKKKIIEFLFLGKIKSAILELYELFMQNTIPIRPQRKFNRHKLPKNKRHMNYKSV